MGTGQKEIGTSGWFGEGTSGLFLRLNDFAGIWGTNRIYINKCITQLVTAKRSE